MTDRRGKTSARGYGWQYQQARRRLLANHPPCHWCGAPATTADHEPPLSVAGHPHLNLVPACGPCNYGRRSAGDEIVRYGPYGQVSGPMNHSREW